MYLYERLIRTVLESDNGPSIRQLGKDIGVPAVTLHDWLNLDKKPHLKNLIRLSEYFKLPLASMLIDTENNNSLIERIVILANSLTPDQQQQIVNQMEQCVDSNRSTAL